MKSSNLQIQSNLMVMEALTGDKLYRHFYPGDYYGVVHPEYSDSRNIDTYMSAKQIAEYRQVKVCLICKRSCAGTCR